MLIVTYCLLSWKSMIFDRKAQFMIAEQGIAELAGAVTAQSDSSKELTND